MATSTTSKKVSQHYEQLKLLYAKLEVYNEQVNTATSVYSEVLYAIGIYNARNDFKDSIKAEQMKAVFAAIDKVRAKVYEQQRAVLEKIGTIKERVIE